MRKAVRLLGAYGLLLLLVLAAGPPTRALVVAALLLCAGLHAVSLWQTQSAAPPRPIIPGRSCRSGARRTRRSTNG